MKRKFTAPPMTMVPYWVKIGDYRSLRRKRTWVLSPLEMKLDLKATSGLGLSQCLVNSPLNVQRGLSPS